MGFSRIQKHLQSEQFYDAILAAAYKHGWRQINHTPSFEWRFDDLCSYLYSWLIQQKSELLFYLRPERGRYPNSETILYLRNLPYRTWTTAWYDGLIELHIPHMNVAEMIAELRVDPDDWQREFVRANEKIFG